MTNIRKIIQLSVQKYIIAIVHNMLIVLAYLHLSKCKNKKKLYRNIVYRTVLIRNYRNLLPCALDTNRVWWLHTNIS